MTSDNYKVSDPPYFDVCTYWAFYAGNMQGCDTANESVIILVIKVLRGDPAVAWVTSPWQWPLREIEVILYRRHPEQADVEVDAVSVTVKDHTRVREHEHLCGST